MACCSSDLTELEEHYVILGEPNSVYIDHITHSKASSIAQSLVDSLSENGIATENVAVIGCDGTALNTGKYGGIIAHLEKKVNKAFQRSICLFHCNKLPLRHLFHYYDGTSSGPKSFSGTIGHVIAEAVHQRDVVAFSA